MYDGKLKKLDSSNILNIVILKAPLKSNFPECLTALCYHPHDNYRVYNYIFHTFLLFSVHALAEIDSLF